MIPNSFDYVAPKSVQEALNLLSKHSDDSKVLAGGHSLLPQMKLRLAAPKVLIDIGRIPDLAYIKQEKGSILIGAMTTHYALESSSLLQQHCQALAETGAAIGDVQVRNRGTIGGSLVHADPAADWPAAMLALDAEFKLVDKSGQRTVGAKDFFVDMLATALRPDELLTEIRIAQLQPRTGTAYLKMPQKASGFALVGVAVRLTADAGQTCQDVAIGITGIASKAYRAAGVEGELKGKKLEANLLKQAAQKAADGVDAMEDLSASSDYRAHLARVYTRRALEKALDRIK